MNLLKVMIVDDESLFRELLITTINWDAIGLTVCCEAKSGAEALDKAKQYKPDIALVDINMPNMDGIKLSELLKELFVDIAVILITGHSEFEYARKAVKLGVVDYILKPFEDEELIKVLLKSKNALLKLKEEQSVKGSSKLIIREKLLNSLIISENSLGEKEIERQMEFLGIKINSQMFSVASIEIDNMYQKWSDIGDILLWKNSVMNIADDILASCVNHFVFESQQGRISAIIEVGDENQGITDILSLLKELCKAVEKYLHFTITVGLGNVYQGYKNIRKSHIESVAALQNKIINGNNKVIEYLSLQDQALSTGFYSGEVSEDLLISLRMSDWDKVKLRIDSVFEYTMKNNLTVDSLYIICSGLISLCLSYIIERGNEINDLFGYVFLPLQEMKQKESVEKLHQWILELFETTLNYCGKNKLTRSKKTVESIKEYISVNYSQCDLDLNQIARHFLINPDYLRSIFRKELGMTLIEYLSNIRLRKAKELLISRQYKLSSIAEMVGYSDPGYFSKCFKKFFGVSPSDYEVLKK